MRSRRLPNQLLNIGIAAVWGINGLVCKVLHVVPRHEAIVARILGPAHSGIITTIIGALELLMAAWILSRIKPRLNTIVQVAVIACMNTIEFLKAPDLLLFGRMNAVWAALLISIILINEYVIRVPGLVED